MCTYARTRVVLVLASFLSVGTVCLGSSLRAFSLREANRVLEQGAPPSKDLQTLSGITRFAGMVFDRNTSDVILAGKLRDDLPAATLDDLVVALRCVIVKQEYPVVSIDAVPDTATSLRQEVRFKGGIEQSRFGRDFLESDVLLKRYSLDLLERVASIRPYSKIYEDAVKKKIEAEGRLVEKVQWCSAEESTSLLKKFRGQTAAESEAVQSRFWFYNRDEFSHVTEIDDVYVIDELRLGVKVEVLGGSAGDASGENPPRMKDESSEQFAAEFTEHYQEACSQYPSLNRLKVLFDMAAIATGIAHLGDERPALDYLLNKYPVQAVSTPRTYPLLNKLGQITCARDGVSTLVLLSGGVELKPLLVELEDGVPSAFREIVLLSRPDQRSVSWALPLDGWDMPNDEWEDAQEQELNKGEETRQANQPDDLGFSLTRQAFIFDKAAMRNAPGTLRFGGFLHPRPVPPLSVPPMVFRPVPRIVTGGVDMRMNVDDGAIRPDATGELDSLREQILNGRPPDSPE